MKRGLQNNEFSLHYQPLIDTRTKETVGLEALLRWKDESDVSHPPIKFIPVAEETGIIHEIGLWVLEEAISQTKKWQENGYRQIPVSVNVSNIQLDNPYFFDEIKEIMEKYELEAKYLNLEITESFMAQKDRTMEFIKKIKEYGIKISIDDFGTGYSSLQYLIDTPFDTVKIDRTFVHDIENSEMKKGLMKGILFIAKALGIKTVAEGIEKKGEFDCPLKYGCDVIQGYYFSKPIPGYQIEACGFINK